MKKTITFILAFICASVPLVDAQITEKPEFGKFAITNATIHTITNGVIEDGVLVIEEHEITFVGTNVRIPDDVRVIDGTGKHVYPGFIDSRTFLGLREIGAVSLTLDHAEVGDYNPHMMAFTAINPHAAAIPVTRVSGVTNVISVPASGVLSGKAVLMDLWGYTPDDMSVKQSAGLHLEWPSAMKRGAFDSRSDEEIEKEYQEALKELNDFWRKAEFYDRMMTGAAEGAGTGVLPDRDLKMEAMREVIRGHIPVIISVEREKDIRNALEWAGERSHLNFVFSGVSEGWRVAEEFVAAEIPVITSSMGMPPRPYDNYQRAYQNAGLMAEAGVRVLLGTGQTENVRNLLFHAGYAATYGMGREEALRAVTLYPAQFWGVDDRLGSLEAGKQANLFIADGDPFEPVTQIEQVFINGYKIPMDSRQIQLYHEFLDRNAVNR